MHVKNEIHFRIRADQTLKPHTLIQFSYFILKRDVAVFLNVADSWFENNYIVKCIKFKTEKFSKFAAKVLLFVFFDSKSLRFKITWKSVIRLMFHFNLLLIDKKILIMCLRIRSNVTQSYFIIFIYWLLKINMDFDLEN